MRKIAVLTSGGDAAGMNAAVRAGRVWSEVIQISNSFASKVDFGGREFRV